MTDTKTLAEMPGHLIRRLNQKSTSVFQEHVRHAGYDVTSVQFATLATLEKHPGLDQASLAKQIAYDRATIGGVIKRLVQKDLIQRLPHEEDRRAYQLWLSPNGKTLLADLQPLVDELQNDILCDLTAVEKTKFLKLLKKALGISVE